MLSVVTTETENQKQTARQRLPIVLKFGSSVLRNLDDYRIAVAEIYRHMRDDRPVVAVVSALAGETDALFSQGNGFAPDTTSFALSTLVATGERKSAALLALACEQAGVKADLMDTRGLDFRAQGPAQSAKPNGLNLNSLKRALQECDCVIVPGFYARDEFGNIVLLGRGGSDFTAAFIAKHLALPSVRLIKDVDGVYDADPAHFAGTAKRYHHLNWATAAQKAGKLVQPETIAWAADQNLALEIGQVGAEKFSVIGSVNEAPTQAEEELKPLRVSIAGCGVVGSAVIEHIALQPERYELVNVLVKTIGRPRKVKVTKQQFVTTTSQLLAGKPDVVIDVLSSDETSQALIEGAVAAGIPVISACKQILATKPNLIGDAEKQKVPLLYSSAVGGGCQMLETVSRAAALDHLVSIEAVLNGTVNFILNALAGGLPFEEALLLAQKAGLAEADASADLEGKDAVAKIVLLARAAFGKTIPFETVKTQTLDAALIEQMKQAGGTWRQVTRCVKDQHEHITAEVSFEKVDADGLLANLLGEANAICITGKSGRQWTAAGKGAGGVPTAHSVFADLEDIRRLIRP